MGSGLMGRRGTCEASVLVTLRDHVETVVIGETLSAPDFGHYISDFLA